MELSGQLHSLAALSPERTPVPVEQEAECSQRAGRTFWRTENTRFPYTKSNRGLFSPSTTPYTADTYLDPNLISAKTNIYNYECERNALNISKCSFRLSVCMWRT